MPISCVEVIQPSVESSIPSSVAFPRFGEDHSTKHHLRCWKCGGTVGCECEGAIRLSTGAAKVDPYMMSGDAVAESPHKKGRIGEKGEGGGDMELDADKVEEELELGQNPAKI